MKTAIQKPFMHRNNLIIKLHRIFIHHIRVADFIGLKETIKILVGKVYMKPTIK